MFIFRKSLGTRIKAFFLLVGLLPLILSSLLFLFITQNTLKEITYRNLQTHVESTTRDIAHLMFRGYVGIKVLANNPIIASSIAGQSEKLAEMRRIQEFYKLYDRITLASPEGTIVTSTGPDYLENWIDQPWFHEVKNGKVLISDLYLFKPFLGTLVFAAPVLDSENKVLYVLVGQVNLEQIWEITDRVRIGQSGYITLIDRTGRLLAHPDKEMILKPLNSPQFLEAVLQNNFKMFSYPLFNGTQVLAAYSLLHSEAEYALPEWRVIAIQSESEAFALIRAVKGWTWILMGVGLLFILPLSLGLTRSIIEPIQVLVAGAQKIAKGDLNNRLRINSQDELGTLSQVFNEMAESLEKHATNLEQLIQDRTLELEIERGKAEDRAQKLAVINKISQVISFNLNLEKVLQVAVRTVGQILEANQCVLMIIEKGSGRIRSKYQYDQDQPRTELIDVPIPLERYPELKEAIKTRRPVVVNDIQKDPLVHEVKDFLTKRGIRSILVFPLTLEDKVLGLLVLRWGEKAILLKEEEIRLGEIIANQIAIALRNAQLFAEERRLEEMKREFTTIIIHDLKNPLSAIIGFSELLMRTVVKDHRTKDEQYLRNILYYANLLLGMVHNILEVHKMEEGNLKLQEKVVPLSLLSHTVAKQFEVLAEQEGITLMVEVPEDLPLVRIDSQIMSRVLANIVHNGIKHTRQNGRIILRAERGEGGWIRVKIQDTGIGIPAGYLDKIFDKYVQIESRKTGGEVSVGIGLYFCKLAMEAHGGQIWAESQEGVGSTFYLAIPPDRIMDPESKIQSLDKDRL